MESDGNWFLVRMNDNFRAKILQRGQKKSKSIWYGALTYGNGIASDSCNQMPAETMISELAARRNEQLKKLK